MNSTLKQIQTFSLARGDTSHGVGIWKTSALFTSYSLIKLIGAIHILHLLFFKADVMAIICISDTQIPLSNQHNTS
jgi:hypothetical protein